MRLTILILSTLAALSGCTAVHETLLPHRELLSPCACEDDAVPVNRWQARVELADAAPRLITEAEVRA